MSPRPKPARDVARFDDLARAHTDTVDRGDCVIFDIHGFWWSVPAELNVHQIAAQFGVELERIDCRPFTHAADSQSPIDAPYRVALHVVPERLASREAATRKITLVHGERHPV